MRNVVAVVTFILSSCAFAQDSARTDNTVLIVPDPAHPWAAAQIGAALADPVTYHEGSLLEALSIAQAGKAQGVVDIKLDTDAVWETGRVVCYAPNGKKIWEKKVSVNFGGGAESVARKFADKLERQVAGKHCSSAAR